MFKNFDFTALEGFEWDEGNVGKNWIKHRVTAQECEEVFFNLPLILLKNPKHSMLEKRYGALGRTDQGRLLSIFFTVRNKKVRVISARNQSRREKTTFTKIVEK